MTLKEELTDRITKLQAKRNDFAVEAKAQVAEMDRRLGILNNLLLNWDATTIDQAETIAQTAGLKVRVVA